MLRRELNVPLLEGLLLRFGVLPGIIGADSELDNVLLSLRPHELLLSLPIAAIRD